VICNSSAAAAEVVHHLDVDPARVSVVLNAVNVERITALARVPLDDAWTSDGAVPLIVSAGSLSARKDMGTLLHALALVNRTRPCNLMILGEGPERSRLEQLARELELEGVVRMPGFLINPFPWIARADVFVSASLAEGCPNVIQQALACGTPIVATDCPGGTAEVIEHGRWGRLVPTRDPEAMAIAIVAALDDPDPPDGRVRAAEFDGPATANRYLQLLLPDARSSGRSSRPARNTQSVT
jgi:glycosyltransferase involved in cell wall biosynthesis